MNDILMAFACILATVNLFAVMIITVTIGKIYNRSSIIYECVAQVLSIIITVVNVVCLGVLSSANHAGLALLLQIVILTIYVLVIKAILSDDNKTGIKSIRHKIKL